MATPAHYHSINKAIPAAGWSSIRNRIAQVAHALEDNQVLTVNLPSCGNSSSNDRIRYALGKEEALFVIERKWEKSWYGSATLKTSSECPAIWDIFQRAGLLIASHYARVHSVDFKITSEGSYEGWCLAAKIASWATEDPIFEKETYLESLVSSGYLAPAMEADGFAQWAVAAIDQPIFDIATTAMSPADNAPCAPWQGAINWFF